MSEIVIRVENLGKRYKIGAQQERYKTLRESLVSAVTIPLNRIRSTFQRSNVKPSNDFIWALKDVSFEVKQGEVVGIIGRNGAGKSTLLKILAHITEPTEGRVRLHGRVGSLLEVGTGFHPELTGRENIYLNGAILGMKKAEIERKFDEIAAFAEIEKFLDTPVKHYSSGMYVRLAFAVAAHLEPEILLVDEVLAVGDLAFQNKCLNHMRSLTKSGKTIVFVSHNMAAIQSSCSRVVYLNQGQITAAGDTLSMIDVYRKFVELSNEQGESGSGGPSYEFDNSTGITIKRIEIINPDGTSSREIEFGETLQIKIHIFAKNRIEKPMINFGLRRGDGINVCNFNNWYDGFEIDYLEGECILEGWLPPLRLIPHIYEVHVLVWPWAGGHLPGEMSVSKPLATRVMGDLRVNGPAFNTHDGVFQSPALHWRFQRGEYILEMTEISPVAIHDAFTGLTESSNS